MRDIYSSAASFCGFVEESTNKAEIIKTAKVLAKKRSQELYLESIELEDDELEIDDEIEGIELDDEANDEIDGIELEDDEVEIEDEIDEAPVDGFEALLARIAEKLGVSLEEDDESEDDESEEDEESEDESEDETEDKSEEDESEDEESEDETEEGFDGSREKADFARETMIQESRKLKAREYLKRRKQDLVLESIQLEEDSPVQKVKRPVGPSKPIRRK